MARYSVNNYTVDVLLADIKSGNIAIPEMQRPFVWDATQVRDLMDSLYKGFPVGYRMAKSKCKVERRNSCNREKSSDRRATAYYCYGGCNCGTGGFRQPL